MISRAVGESVGDAVNGQMELEKEVMSYHSRIENSQNEPNAVSIYCRKNLTLRKKKLGILQNVYMELNFYFSS